MPSRPELAAKILAALCSEDQARVMGALHAGVPVRVIAAEFGIPNKSLRRLMPRRAQARLAAAETDGEILDAASAKTPERWCERDPSKTVPLSEYGKREANRRAALAIKVDSLLRSLGREPVSKSTPIQIRPLRPDRVLSDLRQEGGRRGAPFQTRRIDPREAIPTIDAPPWPEDR